MAKRKRLSPLAQTSEPGEGPAPETKAMNGWVGVRARAPIAEITQDTAMQSAFEEVSAELKSAREEGRMIARLPLDAIEERYLVRDRLSQDSDEMDSLIDSLRARGQQTAIEVVDLGGGRYGLISGWRRMQALRQLDAQMPNSDFGFVQAVIRAPSSAADAYCAMVEENEIRSDLSFYERAHIAVKAVEQGVYPDTKTAVQSLFSAARAPKRSKIIAFSTLVDVLGNDLRWPEAIPEKLGLAVASTLKTNPDRVGQFRAALGGARDAAQERGALDQALRQQAHSPDRPTSASASAEVVPGVALQSGRGRITLSGDKVDAGLLRALKDWLRQRDLPS